jgi:hypothetical protein
LPSLTIAPNAAGSLFILPNISGAVALLYSDLDIPNIIVELLNATSYAGLNSVSRTD